MQHVMMPFYQHTKNGRTFYDLEKNYFSAKSLILFFFRLNLSYDVVKMRFDIFVIEEFSFFVKIKKMLNPCSG